MDRFVGALHGREELGQPEGLGENGRSNPCPRQGTGALGDGAGHQDHSHVGPSRAQIGEHGGKSALGEHHVGHHDVEMILFNEMNDYVLEIDSVVLGSIADVFPDVAHFYFYARDKRSPCVRKGSQPYLCVRRVSHHRPRTYTARRGDSAAWGDGVRVFSVRELARIQGCPPTYQWPATHSRAQTMLQVANAVPPPMMECVLGRVPTQTP